MTLAPKTDETMKPTDNTAAQSIENDSTSDQSSAFAGPRIYDGHEVELPQKHRSPWRQRLVDMERGVTHSFRGDSTFFVHLFTATLIFCVAFVLGITALQWVLMSMVFTVVIAAEMFQLAIRRLVRSIDGLDEPVALEVERISAAAVMVAILGAGITITAIFCDRLL